MQRLLVAGVSVALAMALGLGSANAADKKTLAFVVNGASDFWKAAEAGVKKAQGELPNYNLDFKYPEQSSAAIQTAPDGRPRRGRRRRHHGQRGRSEDHDATRSTRSASRSRCSPPTATRRNRKRVAYIGSSNTDAGKQAGELMLKALPNGGKCMGFVGLPGADNARERIEGVKETIKGSKIELVDVRGDDIDQTRAKRNVEDTLDRHPEINCMVGFYSYNTPRIYEALKEAGKLGKITDHRLRRGSDHARRRQGRHASSAPSCSSPYEWGYQGMKLMAKYLEGDKSGIPANGLIIIPTKIIDKVERRRLLGAS